MTPAHHTGAIRVNRFTCIEPPRWSSAVRASEPVATLRWRRCACRSSRPNASRGPRPAVSATSSIAAGARGAGPGARGDRLERPVDVYLPRYRGVPVPRTRVADRHDPARARPDRADGRHRRRPDRRRRPTATGCGSSTTRRPSIATATTATAIGRLPGQRLAVRAALPRRARSDPPRRRDRRAPSPRLARVSGASCCATGRTRVIAVSARRRRC